MRIDIPLMDLRMQKIVEEKESYMELNDTHLLYVLEFTADEVTNSEETDENLWQWKDGVRNFHRLLITRESLCGAETVRDYNNWTVHIKIVDATSIKIKLATKKVAMEIQTALEQYILNTKTSNHEQ